MSDMVATLRREMETLREENVQLRQQLIPALLCPLAWRLTPQETMCFARLASRPLVSFEALNQAAMFRDDIAEENLCKVLVYRIRKKTRAFGVEIKTVKFVGYQLINQADWLKRLTRCGPSS